MTTQAIASPPPEAAERIGIPVHGSPAERDIEAALGELAKLVLAAGRAVEVTVCDYRRDAAGTLAAGRIVTLPSRARGDSCLERVLADQRAGAGEATAFVLGTHGAGSDARPVVALRFSDGDTAIAGGYALLPADPTPDDLRTLRAVCHLGAQYIVGIKRNLLQHLAQSGKNSFETRMQEALRLAADAYWEADDSGVIRRVVVLTSGEPAKQLQTLEGKNLFAAAVGGTTTKGGEFHNVALDLRDGGSTIKSVLSGRLLDDAAMHGVARLVREEEKSGSQQAARAMIEKIESARDHEAAMRRETELILDGLRILTSGAASRDIFRRLLELLSPALGFEAAVALQRDWSGTIAPTVATSEACMRAAWDKSAEPLFLADATATIHRIPEDVTIPEIAGGAYRSALVIALSTGSKATVILCLHGNANFFTSRHVGLGTRLALVASQAFLNEEERQKVVDASKLATVGELAAGIVHEINQPLTAMTLTINTLKEMLEGDGELETSVVVERLEKVRVQMSRVSKIVANMRVLTRHSDETMEVFDIEKCARDAADIIQHKFTSAKIVLDVRCEKPLSAYGKPLEFSQVMINLLSNAHDAIQEKKEGVRRVVVEIAPADRDWIGVTVRDSGCGFPKDRIELAFEPFVTTKKAGQGTGLGLALCRRIMENMGGKIALKNWDGGAEIDLKIKRARV